MRKPRVLLIEPTIQPVGVELLKARADVVFAPDGRPETLMAYLQQDVDGVVLRVERMTAELMAAAPKLKVIGQHGVGVDNIDVEAATARGIQVVHAPLANFTSVAEHVVMLTLALMRRLVEADRAVREGDWAYRDRRIPVELNGKTLLSIGMGAIGTEVSRKMRLAFNMKVLGYDPYVSAEDMALAGVDKVEDLADGLRQAHVISLHVPYTPRTHHLLGAREFDVMKDGAFLINCSRGSVVDPAALYEAARSGKLAGVGLDVFAKEPPDMDDPLLTLENVIVSPHFAGDTLEAKNRCSRVVAEEVLKVLEGRRPRFLVNPESLSVPRTGA